MQCFTTKWSIERTDAILNSHMLLRLDLFIYLFYDDQSGYDVSNIVIIFTALKQNKNNSVECFEMFFLCKTKKGMKNIKIYIFYNCLLL
jgi:hypothetical protein